MCWGTCVFDTWLSAKFLRLITMLSVQITMNASRSKRLVQTHGGVLAISLWPPTWSPFKGPWRAKGLIWKNKTLDIGILQSKKFHTDEHQCECYDNYPYVHVTLNAFVLCLHGACATLSVYPVCVSQPADVIAACYQSCGWYELALSPSCTD